MSIDFKRRQALKAGAATLLTGATATLLIGCSETEKLKIVNFDRFDDTVLPDEKIILDQEFSVRDNLQKVKSHNQSYSDDLFLNKHKKAISHSVLQKILRVQRLVGYTNFNLISFDYMLLYARRYPQIDDFSKSELSFINEMFFYDAAKYGFHGNKVNKELTTKINKIDTVKIVGSGHYLFKDKALLMFNNIKKDVGANLILTSGVRSVVRQLQLFLVKLNSCNGNLSLASRSVAPPGYSYHSIGDFDVGKKGFGKFNFTSRFTDTDEYKKLIKLKYVALRYTKDNKEGVRFEPWHIKVE